MTASRPNVTLKTVYLLRKRCWKYLKPRKKEGRIIEAKFSRRSGWSETAAERCKASWIRHQKKFNGVAYAVGRRRRHGLSRRFWTIQCALCNLRTKKNLLGAATRRVVSYYIQSSGFNVVCCCWKSRVLQRGQKKRGKLRENVAITCLLIYSLSYCLIIYFFNTYWWCHLRNGDVIMTSLKKCRFRKKKGNSEFIPPRSLQIRWI